MGPFPMMLQMQFSHDQQDEIMRRFESLLRDLMTERGIKAAFHFLYAIAVKRG
jgi:hypothetical protein